MRGTIRFLLALTFAYFASPSAIAQPIIYVSDQATGIRRIAPNGTATVYGTGLNGSQGLAFDSTGRLFVANGGAVSIIPPGGGPAQPFATGFGAGALGAMWGPDGNLYVANSSVNTVSRVGPGGGVANVFATGFSQPAGLSFGPDGNLYVANLGNNTVSRVGPGGGAATLFATGFSAPVDVAFDAAGNLYASNNGTNTVSRVGPGGGAASLFATGFSAPYGLAFDILGSGDLYVASNGPGFISRVGPGGGAATLYSPNIPNAAFITMQVPEPSGICLFGTVVGMRLVVRLRRRFATN